MFSVIFYLWGLEGEVNSLRSVNLVSSLLCVLCNCWSICVIIACGVL